MMSSGLIILALAVIAIWIIIESKGLRHKIFAFVLIGIIVVGYLSAIFVFQGQDVDFTSASGVISAGKLYFSWLGTVFSNVKTITGNFIGMDWGVQNNIEEAGDEESVLDKFVK